MRKIISMFCVICVVFSLVNITVSATTSGAIVQVSSAATSGNGEVEIDISIENNPGIMALQMFIEYDNKLILKEVTQGSGLSGLNYTPSGAMDVYPFVLMWDGLVNDYSNGTLVTLKFQAPAEEGSYDINAYSTTGMIYNYDLDNIDVKFESGNVMVSNSINVSNISLNQQSLSMNVGETTTLIATITPENATNKNVVWNSSNVNVATVSNAGVVTAISAGDAIISVITEDGSHNAQCNISVVSPDGSIVDSGVDANGISWTLNEEGVLRFAGTGAMEDYSKAISIPWYDYRGNITEVVFEEGITHIASRVMYNCTLLEKAEIASTVESIGNLAFSRCDDMTIYGFTGTFAEEYATEYEVPFVDITPAPKYNLEVDFSETSKAWYFDIMVDGFSEDAKVYISIYDQNKLLLSIQSEDFIIDDLTSFTFSKNEDAVYYKVFMWLDNMKPVCEAYESEF